MAKWNKIITSGSDATLNHLTSSNIIVNGDLFANLPEAPDNNNLKVVTLSPTNNLLSSTGSYTSGTGGGIQVKIGSGDYIPLQNIVISNFESDIEIDTSVEGTLDITFKASS